MAVTLPVRSSKVRLNPTATRSDGMVDGSAVRKAMWAGCAQGFGSGREGGQVEGCDVVQPQSNRAG